MFILVAAVPTVATAQAIEGRVLTTDRLPLIGANVYIASLERGAVTGEEGRFAIRGLAPGAYEVTFSYVGFRPVTRTVALSASETATLEVALQPAVIGTEEVVVIGERGTRLNESAQAIARLDAEELAEVRGQTFGETVAELPGVTTLQTGPSIAKPVIRGLHSQRVVIMNAGVPLEGQQWGGEHAPAIDPFAPAEVEVIKGAASVEYGAGAIGGVIRLEPRPLPTAPGLGGKLMLNAFSNNMQGAGSLLLEGGFPGAQGWGWRAQGSFRKAGDARTPEYVIGNSAFETYTGSLALGYQAERFGLEGYASRFHTALGIYEGAHIGNVEDLQRAIERGRPLRDYDFSYDIGRPKQTVTHDLFTLRSHYRFDTGARANVQYGLQRNRRREFDAHGPYNDSLAALNRPAFELTLITHTLDAGYAHRPLSSVLGGSLLGKVGLNGMVQSNVNAQVGYLIPNFRAYSGGLFAHETWMRGDWTLEAGMRFDYRWVRAYPREFGSRGDYVERTETYSSLSGVAGAIWQFADTWSLAAHFGTGWRAPSVNELYSFGVHHGTAQFEVGNPDLTSERSYSLNATLRHVSERAQLQLGVFNNHIEDFIYLFPASEPKVTIRGVFPTFLYRQADVVLRGFDGSFSYQVATFFEFGLAASVVRGTNLDLDRPLINMPSDRLSLRGTFHLPSLGNLRDSELEVEGQFVREQTRYPEGVLYAPPPDGYALFSASYSAELLLGSTPLQFTLAVENLFNTTYRNYLNRFRYFIANPGRSLILRLQVPLGL